jgi:hypothetical protein
MPMIIRAFVPSVVVFAIGLRRCYPYQARDVPVLELVLASQEFAFECETDFMRDRLSSLQYYSPAYVFVSG